MRAFLRGLVAKILGWFKRGQKEPADPEAREHAWALSAVFKEAHQTENPKLFQDAVEDDALKSRRAFVSVLEFAKEQQIRSPKDAQAAIVFAGYLAYQIGVSFVDLTPAEIVDDIEKQAPQDELLRKVEKYARGLYPETSEEPA